MAQYDALGIHNERHDVEIDIHPFWFFAPYIDQAAEHITAFLGKILK